MHTLSISGILLESHAHYRDVHKLVPKLNALSLILSVLISKPSHSQSPPPTSREQLSHLRLVEVGVGDGGGGGGWGGR